MRILSHRFSFAGKAARPQAIAGAETLAESEA